MMERQRLTKRARFTTAVAAATLSLAACSTSTQQPAPPTTPSAATAAAQAGDCAVNPSSLSMPTAKPFESVPADARISVDLSDIPSGWVKPGDPPTEVEVTLCNDSPVDYPKVGVVLVLTQCSCATNASGLPVGTGERFDAATNSWVKLHHPVITTGADYLGGFTDVQELPKGKTVTLRYRVALDGSMADGKGGVQAVAVLPGPPVQIGKGNLPFTVSKEAPPPITSRPTALPFTGLTYPSGVAVTAGGDVYLADTGNDRVLTMASGSHEQTVLPFTGLKNPGAIAVDAAGNVYVADGRKRVLKLAAGSNEQTVLPFTGLGTVGAVAADSAGNVYITDYAERNTRVVKLAAGSTEQTVLPFTGVESANGVAVDSAGSVYVNDGSNNRVLKLAAGATDQTALPVTGLQYPQGMAVDAAGDAYVIDGDNREVVKVAAGSNGQTAVPSAGLYEPTEVAVDGAGNLYVIDTSGYGRVVKLAAG